MPLNPKNPTEPPQRDDAALRRRSSQQAHWCAAEDRRRKAGGSFRIFSRRHFIRFSILCSLAFGESAAAPAASGPPLLAIHGTVVDETGTPVPNARVAAVEGSGLMPDFFTQSDAAGKFRLRLASHGFWCHSWPATPPASGWIFSSIPSPPETVSESCCENRG